MHQQLETEMLTSGIRFDFDPSDYFTHAEQEDLKWVESVFTADYLGEQEDEMQDVIDDLDPQDPKVDGLFTPDRLLSTFKHARAGALSIMYTRTRTRMLNMCGSERNAYAIAHDGAIFYKDLETVTDKKELFYALYLAWSGAPDV